MTLEYFYYLLNRAGLSMREVAEKMGLKKDSLYRKASGRNSWNLKDIHKILKILNLKFEEVFLSDE